MNQPPVFTIDNITCPDGPEVVQIRFNLPRGTEFHSKTETMTELSSSIDDIQKISYYQGTPQHKVVKVLKGQYIDPGIIVLFNVQINPNEYYLEEQTLVDGYMWNVTNIFKAPVQAPYLINPIPQPVAAPVVRATEVLPEGEASIPFVQRFQCSTCLTNAVNTRLNPCGHLLCSVCFAQLNPKRCPICRVEPINDEPIFYGGGYYNKLQKYMNKLK
jgi:hypothetical protein